MTDPDRPWLDGDDDEMERLTEALRIKGEVGSILVDVLRGDAPPPFALLANQGTRAVLGATAAEIAQAVDQLVRHGLVPLSKAGPDQTDRDRLADLVAAHRAACLYATLAELSEAVLDALCAEYRDTIPESASVDHDGHTIYRDKGRLWVQASDPDDAAVDLSLPLAPAEKEDDVDLFDLLRRFGRNFGFDIAPMTGLPGPASLPRKPVMDDRFDEPIDPATGEPPDSEDGPPRNDFGFPIDPGAPQG